MKEKIKWDNEKKVKLIQLEEQVRNGEIGFMERLKREWVECTQNSGIWLCNAWRFKDKTIINLILVRNREVTEQLIEVPNEINNE